MRLQRLLATALVMCLCAMPAAGIAQPVEEKKGEPIAGIDTKAIDKHVFITLRLFINLGADVYNRRDFQGCQHLYEEVLTTTRPLLAHRPSLQKAIDEGIVRAQAAALEDRAFVLRTVMDQIRREVNPNPPPTPKTPVVRTLWDRLGGEHAVGRVVDDFVDTAAKDPKVNLDRGGKFPITEKGVVHLKRMLVDLISSVSGGPLEYTGKTMREAHKGMAITNAEFDAAAGHLAAALRKNGVKEDDLKAVMDAVGTTRKDIVETRLPSPLVPIPEPPPPPKTTLWERLGGEKVVTRVVSDFFDTATKDPKVNFDRGGKFKMTPEGAEHAKKLLVEFVSSASGGPLKYTGLSMKDAHAGMGITDAEFSALADHLGAALRKNGVKEEEVLAVLNAVESTRKDIVEKRP